MEKQLFQQHVTSRLEIIKDLLEKNSLDSIAIDAGRSRYYYLDDQHPPFRSNPHFTYFCPASGEGHLIHILAGSTKPTLYFYQPSDFWHEVEVLGDQFWTDAFDIKIIDQPIERCPEQLPKNNTALISPDQSKADRWGLQKATETLLHQIHWERGKKTAYEIFCIDKANQAASIGHQAAQKAFLDGLSELEILHEYLSGSKQREVHLPYGAIVGLGEHAAVLHYQNPKNDFFADSFLIDAGAKYNGYCSDITRTYASQKAHPVFKTLISQMEQAQLKQCQLVKPGTNYVDIHHQACIDISNILIENHILLCSLDEAMEKSMAFPFFPHGLGHPLGIQVHDVAAKQKNSTGEPIDQPKDYPYLRTLREIQKNDVLTIEPGLYFIPDLLEALKEDSQKKNLVNWDLVSQLVNMGGIRIEDNVVARVSGPENLTRKHLP